jgi:3-demethylubiquinone-9 3-methyltransferase
MWHVSAGEMTKYPYPAVPQKTREEGETAMPDNVLTACLWFNTQAEEAASFYVGTFKGSRLGGVHQHTEAGPGRG